MSYIVYHPGTDTFVPASESYLIPVDDLPAEFDEWEDYIVNTLFTGKVRKYELEKGRKL